VAARRSVSIAGSASDAVIISGDANQVTVYLATGVTRSVDVSEPVASHTTSIGPNPYRGLAAFFEEDADRFFGRDKQIARLWEAFRALHELIPGASPRRILPILGPSGSGKSSLARAGLVPEIARHTLPTLQAPRVVVLTPTAHPVEALARILVRVITDDQAPVTKVTDFEAELRRSTDGRYEGLRRLARFVPEIDRRKLVVLVDQFEETYTLCTDPTEQEAFVGNLLHAGRDAGTDVTVIFTLRTDFIGSTQRHPELNRIVTGQGIIVPAMDESEVRDAIMKPAADAGRPFDAALVELLVQDTLGREGALPLLQFALQRLWDATCEGKDSGETFQAIGGVGGALAQEADELYESLPDGQKKIVRRAFRSMVHLGEGVGDTRRRVDLDTIVSRGESRDEVLSVLRTFAQPSKRLVTLEGEGRDVRAEVTHEALIARWNKIRTWLGPEQREDERFHRQVAEAVTEWKANGQRSDLLWRGFNLGRLREFFKRSDDELTESEYSFLEACESAEHETELARTRRTQMAWMAALVMAALTIVALWQWKEAEQQHQRAEQNLVQAERQRNQALVTQTRFLADLAMQKIALGDGTTAALLALEGLPDTSAGIQRPLISASEKALYAASRVLSEKVDVKFHRSPIPSMAISPDRQRVVTGGGNSDPIAVVWNARTGEVIRGLGKQSAESAIENIAFSADGRKLAIASGEIVRVWNSDSGEALFDLQGHTKTVWRVAFTPDGRKIVTGSFDNTARIWNAENGKLLVTLAGPILDEKLRKELQKRSSDEIMRNVVEQTHAIMGSMSQIAVGPDSRFVVTAGAFGDIDGAPRLWDLSSGRQVLSFKAKQDSVLQHFNKFAFSPDGTMVLAASFDKKAFLWNLKTGALIHVLEGHTGPLSSARFSPDGKNIVTASSDGSARIWKASSGAVIATLKGHTGWVTTAAFSPDGRQILTTSRDKTARVWDAATGSALKVLWHTSEVIDGDFLSDRTIVTTATDGAPRIWNMENEGFVAKLQGQQEQISDALFGPDARTVITSSPEGLRLWELVSGKELASIGHPPGFDPIWEFSRDGNRILTVIEEVSAGLYNQSVMIFDAATGGNIAVLRGHQEEVKSARFSRDGNLVVTASQDGKARIWDVASGQAVVALIGHKDQVNSAQFSPDGQLVLTASQDGTARIWNAANGQEIVVLKVPAKGIGFAIFSPDGHRVLTMPNSWYSDDQDKALRLWDGTTGAVIATLDGRLARFSPNGLKLAVVDDKIVHIVDSGTGEELAVLKGHEDRLRAISFSQDATLLASGGDDGTARIWDVATGQQIAVMTGHEKYVRSVIFTPDRKRLITWSSSFDAGAKNSNSIRTWDVATATEVDGLQKTNGEFVRPVVRHDGTYVLHLSEGGIGLIWRIFPTAQKLVDYVKSVIPRCLSPQQRMDFFLDAEPPAWCVTLEKWPYHTQDWKEWLNYRRNGLNPPLPDSPEWSPWVAGRDTSRVPAAQ
jgi:WD40 repeat protein